MSTEIKKKKAISLQCSIHKTLGHSHVRGVNRCVLGKKSRFQIQQSWALAHLQDMKALTTTMTMPQQPTSAEHLLSSSACPDYFPSIISLHLNKTPVRKGLPSPFVSTEPKVPPPETTQSAVALGAREAVWLPTACSPPLSVILSINFNLRECEHLMR